MTEGRRVTDELREAIVSGDYPPGAVLRQEELAQRFAATRMPVREAIRALQREGLVRTQRFRAEVVEFDLRDLTTLYQMRERIEPLALRVTMPLLTDADFDFLDEIQDRIEATTDVDDFMRLDRELHLRTYSRCDVEFLSQSVTDLWNATEPYRRRFMLAGGSHRVDVVNTEHRLLLDSIRQADFNGAERLLEGHIRRTRVELTTPVALSAVSD